MEVSPQIMEQVTFCKAKLCLQEADLQTYLPTLKQLINHLSLGEQKIYHNKSGELLGFLLEIWS